MFLLTHFCNKIIILFKSYKSIVLFLFSSRKLRRLDKKNKIINNGYCSYLFIPGNLNNSRLTLQKVTINSGRLKKRIYSSSGHGHSVALSPITSKGYLVPENGLFITEFDLQTLKPLDRIYPTNKLTSGHAVCSQDGQRLYFADRNPDSKEQEGILNIFDISTRKIINTIDDVGIFSHEVIISHDENFAIVASYGRATYFVSTNEPKNKIDTSINGYKPTFCVINIQTGTIVKKITIQKNIHLAHLAFGQAEQCFFIQGTSLYFTKGWSEDKLNHAIQNRMIPLSEEEKRGNALFLPGFLFKVTFPDCHVEELSRPPLYRTQSLVYCTRFNKIYETNAVSNTVAITDASSGKIIKIIDGNKQQIIDPRGIALTNDEQFLIITGRYNNIYFVNTANDMLYIGRTFRSYNWLNSHIAAYSVSQN